MGAEATLGLVKNATASVIKSVLILAPDDATGVAAADGIETGDGALVFVNAELTDDGVWAISDRLCRTRSIRCWRSAES